MKRTLRFLLLIALATVLVTAIVLGTKFLSALYAHSKFDENGGRVWALAKVIELAQPPDASRQSVLIALRRDGIKDPESALYDAWHRPLRVNIWRDQAQQYHYEVMSSVETVVLVRAHWVKLVVITTLMPIGSSATVSL